MDPQAFEGTWEEVGLRHGSKLAGKKVRVIVLDAPSLSEEADSDMPWIIKRSERLFEAFSSRAILKCFSLLFFITGGLVAGQDFFFKGGSYTGDSTFIVIFQLVGLVGILASLSDSSLEQRLGEIEKRQAKQEEQAQGKYRGDENNAPS